MPFKMTSSIPNPACLVSFLDVFSVYWNYLLSLMLSKNIVFLTHDPCFISLLINLIKPILFCRFHLLV
jgi:hypothetical protein